MRVVSENAEAKVRFFEQHLAVWTASVDAVGPDAVEFASAETLLSALATDLAEARAAVDAQRLARDAARSATARAHHAVAALGRSGSGAIQWLRGVHGVDNVSATQLPAPRQRRKSVGPPGTPERFAYTLGALGVITVTWRCEQPDNAGGTIYYVSRRLDGGPWIHLETVGKRRFVDDTLPAGTATATYQVQAARSTARGPVAEFTVRLGVDPGTAALRAARAPRMTAVGKFSSVVAA